MVGANVSPTLDMGAMQPRRPLPTEDSYGYWSHDAMDIDYDPELATWFNSWDAAPPNSSSQHMAPRALSSQTPLPPGPVPMPAQVIPQQQQQAQQLHTQQAQQQPQPVQQPQPQTQQQQPLLQIPMLQQQQHQNHQPLPLHNQQRLMQPEKLTPSIASSQESSSGYDTGSVPVDFTESDFSKAAKMLGPDDFLFPDDEVAAVVSNQLHVQNRDFSDPMPQHIPAAPPSGPIPGLTAAETAGRASREAAPAGLDLNDPTTLELYDEMLLFSRGNHQAQDKLAFDGCDAAKEAVLHRLALKFKLSYSYDPVQRKASIWRPSAFSPVRQSPPTMPSTGMGQHQSFEATMPSAPTPVLVTAPSSAPPSAQPSAPAMATFQPTSQTMSPPRFHQPMGESGKQKRHTITGPMTFSLLQQDANTVGLSVGLTPPAAKRLSSDSSAAASAVSALGLSHGLIGDDDKNNGDTPSLGDRLSSSWSIFHSGISSRRPRGRRGPLSAKSRKDIKDLEWAGGACWRCKILRRKCDPGIPCKNCPAPDLRQDAPPWPLIGCRRGNLRDAMPPQVLCTKSRALLSACSRKLPAILAAENVVDNLTGGPPPAQPDVVSQCFREAEMQCLSDNKLVLDNPALFLRTHSQSVAAHHYSQAIRNGRYRANDSLNVACQVHERSSTYSDLTSSIAWELADNSECLNVLEIESVESFMMLLETSCLYEVEVGKVSSNPRNLLEFQ